MHHPRPLLLLAMMLAACGGDDDGGGSADGGGPGADSGSTDAGGADAYVPTDVELLTYMDGVLAPLEFVAWQDGDGDWEALDSETGLYEFTPSTGRYSLASMCPGVGEDTSVWYMHATAAEMPRPSRRCGGEDLAGTGAIEVTVSGLGAGDTADAHIKSGTGALTQADPVYSFTALAPGMRDVLLKVDNADDGFDRIALVHDVEVTNGNTTDVAISATTDADPNSTFTMAGTGALQGDEEPSHNARLWSKNGVNASVTYDTDSFGGVPASFLEARDVHVVNIVAWDAGEGTQRKVYVFNRQASNVEVPYPPAFALDSVGAASISPYVRIEADFPAHEDAAFYTIVLRQNGVERIVAANITPGWLGGGDNLHWEEPDLSGVDGWDNGWALEDNVVTSVFAAAYTGGDAAFSAMQEFTLQTPPTADYDGLVVTESHDNSSFTP